MVVRKPTPPHPITCVDLPGGPWMKPLTVTRVWQPRIGHGLQHEEALNAHALCLYIASVLSSLNPNSYDKATLVASTAHISRV